MQGCRSKFLDSFQPSVGCHLIAGGPKTSLCQHQKKGCVTNGKILYTKWNFLKRKIQEKLWSTTTGRQFKEHTDAALHLKCLLLVQETTKFRVIQLLIPTTYLKLSICHQRCSIHQANYNGSPVDQYRPAVWVFLELERRASCTQINQP